MQALTDKENQANNPSNPLIKNVAHPKRIQPSQRYTTDSLIHLFDRVILELDPSNLDIYLKRRVHANVIKFQQKHKNQEINDQDVRKLSQIIRRSRRLNILKISDLK